VTTGVAHLSLLEGDDLVDRVKLFSRLSFNRCIIPRGGGVVVNTGEAHLLAFTRYCNHQHCMVYDIKRGVRWGGVFCGMVVQ